jgi:hypothetical protein
MVILCSMSTHRALGFEKAPGIRSLGSRLYIYTFRSLADSLAGKLEPIRLDESTSSARLLIPARAMSYRMRSTNEKRFGNTFSESRRCIPECPIREIHLALPGRVEQAQVLGLLLPWSAPLY